MDMYNYIWIAIGIYNLVIGAASLFTGKVYNLGKKADQYTEESLKAFARPSGLGYLIMGIGFILEYLLPGKIGGGENGLSIGLVVCFGCLAVALIIILFAYKKLVKKNAQ